MKVKRQKGIFEIEFDTEKADFEAKLNYNKIGFLADVLVEVNEKLLETNQYRRGITGDILGQNKSLSRGRNNSNKLDHSEVLKMLNEGVKQSVVAKHFKVSSQAISYIKFKNKEDKKETK